MLPTPRDHRAKCGKEGQPRNTELISPQRPDACLVDQGLANVQAYPSRGCLGRSQPFFPRTLSSMSPRPPDVDFDEPLPEKLSRMSPMSGFLLRASVFSRFSRSPMSSSPKPPVVPEPDAPPRLPSMPMTI